MGWGEKLKEIKHCTINVSVSTTRVTKLAGVSQHLNALRPTGLGVISLKLVTWVKDALCFKLYVYILKKEKNNNPNPRKLTLEKH